MKKTPKKKLTNADYSKRIGILAGMLLYVIQGLRNGSVRSKPMLNTGDKNATEWKQTTLEEEIWKALKKVGITEKKQPAKTATL